MRHLYLVYTFVFVLVLSINSCAKRVTIAKSETPTVVTRLPRQHKVVRIKGRNYYYFNRKHYQKTRRSYVVVRI